MPKLKISLFFHTENENEKRAYEILSPLRRKKTSVITNLILTHEGEIAEYLKKERNYATSKNQNENKIPENNVGKLSDEIKPDNAVGTDPPVKSNKPQFFTETPDTDITEKVNTADAANTVNTTNNEETVDTADSKNSTGINKSLVLKGLSAFQS
ncbi:MAG: hypothetical protein ACI4FX_03025 [Agathobacter sp.]